MAPNVIKAKYICWMSTLRNFKKFYKNCPLLYRCERAIESIFNTFLAHMFWKKKFHCHNISVSLGRESVMAYIHFCVPIMRMACRYKPLLWQRKSLDHYRFDCKMPNNYFSQIKFLFKHFVPSVRFFCVYVSRMATRKKSVQLQWF